MAEVLAVFCPELSRAARADAEKLAARIVRYTSLMVSP